MFNDFSNDSLYLRPETLDSFIGQDNIKELLNIAIKAAKIRNECLDHVLLIGPEGLGKTTLAEIIANEMGSNIKFLSAPSLEKRGDIASSLSSLEEGDILFIDEIHRLKKTLFELLYSALEDFCIDVLISDNYNSKSIRIDLPPFTLIAATTNPGDLPSPFRARFLNVYNLDYYSLDNLFEICIRTSKVFKIGINDDAALEIARRSRGTPRVLNRIFRRVRDFATLYNNDLIDLDICLKALSLLDINKYGLNKNDLLYLKTILFKFNGGPCGISSISKYIGLDILTIENMYEPYLIKEGFIKRTLRGRVCTKKTYVFFNIPYDKEMK